MSNLNQAAVGYSVLQIHKLPIETTFFALKTPDCVHIEITEFRPQYFAEQL